MHDNDPKIGPFGIRDALYLSLGALVVSISWREWLWWRFAVEELRLEQRMLLSEIRRVQTSVAALEKKIGETSASSSPDAKVSASKRPSKPRAKRSHDTNA